MLNVLVLNGTASLEVFEEPPYCHAGKAGKYLEKVYVGNGSPIMANIYMHYILVWWFKECIVPRGKGYGSLVVYADDFAVCLQYKEEAGHVGGMPGTFREME